MTLNLVPDAETNTLKIQLWCGRLWRRGFEELRGLVQPQHPSHEGHKFCVFEGVVSKYLNHCGHGYALLPDPRSYVFFCVF